MSRKSDNLITYISFLIGMSETMTILGSGPGGYKSAVHAAERGYDVTLIEKKDIGGVCTNRGCIPSKALLSVAETIDDIEGTRRKGIDADLNDIDIGRVQSVRKRAVSTSRKGIENLMDQYDVDVVQGEGEVVGENKVKVDGEEIEADHIIIATGSEPISLPGIEIDGENILSSRDALSLKEAPDTMLIIGGGYIGVEMAFLFSSFGTDVTIVELLDRCLPAMDKDMGPVVEKVLKRKGIKIHTGSKVTDIEKEDKLHVSIEGDTEKEMDVDKVLCCVGRRPTPPEITLDIIGDDGEIVVDEKMRTSVNGVYGVGDVNGKSMLAHSAYKQAEIAVADMAGEETKGFHEYSVPAGVYIHPEVASVGLKEKEAEEEYDEVDVDKCSISSIGRGYATGERTGFAKVISSGDELLGLHLICPGATDLIMEATVAIEQGMSVEELAEIIHPHPTYSEAIKKALKGE